MVIGSQAVLGQFPDADPALLVSMEADVYRRNHPERSDLIDGSIGEASPFEREFGYYAHGVDGSTAVLPRGWQDRLVAARLRQTELSGSMRQIVEARLRAINPGASGL